MDIKQVKMIQEYQKSKKLFEKIDKSNRLQDEDILFILHKSEVQFLDKELHWFIKKYPKSKYKEIIHDILKCLE